MGIVRFNEGTGTPVGQLVLHTAEEAARVKQSWLERQAAARKIPFAMLGGSYRFSDRHLDEIVRTNEQVPVPATPDSQPAPRTTRKEHGRTQSSATVAPAARGTGTCSSAPAAATSAAAATASGTSGPPLTAGTRPAASEPPHPCWPMSAPPSPADPSRPGRAVPDETFEVPSRRGVTRLTSDAAAGRCAHCGRSFRRRLNGTLIAHESGGRSCPGSRQPPADDVMPANWLPLLPGLTPHGLRHGHQTWMEEAGTSDLLRSERMNHEVPGMRGIYGHVTPAMRATLTTMLQERWQASLRERAQLSPRSIVPVLDALLTAQRELSTQIGSQSAPKIEHQRAARLAESKTDGH